MECVKIQSVGSKKAEAPEEALPRHERCSKDPGGTSISGGRGGGGLDLTSSLETKFGARSSQVHQIRGKIWEVLLPQGAKVWKNPNFGVKSEIQRTKFGVFVTYIVGGKIWGSNKISEANFGAKRPRPPNMEVPSWGRRFFLSRNKEVKSKMAIIQVQK